MSLDSQTTEDRPLTGVDALVASFREAERPGGGLIGLEHEKFIVPEDGSRALPYLGASGIEAVLTGFARFGWAPYREGEGLPVIAMTRGKAAISLEPGGQLELSGSPFRSAREAHAENEAHLAELRQVLAPLKLRAIALGYRPFDVRDEMPWMPKSRYRVMRQTLGTRGSMALDMMLMTATGQVSLDWRTEADCARKVMVSARLSPVLVALYANSPLVAGRPSGYLSYRSHVWSDVDRARCGYVPAMLDGSFSYRAYVEWALDAPLLFLRRRGQYLAPALTFRQLLAQGFEGQPAQESDWVDHLSTLFPEVRIKRVLEIRAADCNGAAMTGALGAIMRGLLYDDQALGALEAALPKLSPAAHLAWHEATQREGLAAQVSGRPTAHVARDVLAIAREGLARLDPGDADLLAPLEALAVSGRSPALTLLERAADAPAARLSPFTL
jgi:glutamate--cysteine ligase